MNNGSLPSAIFIDLDGTLGDSMTALFTVYHEFLKKFGYAGTKEEFYTLMGPPIAEVIEIIKEKYALQEDSSLLHQHYTSLIKIHLEKVPLMPGAQEFLDACKKRKVPIIMVTSASRSYAKRFIQKNKLENYFEAIIAFEDAPMSKPHPAPYLTALMTAKTSSEDAFAIEDSSSGVASATGAGLRTFWIAPHGAQDHSQVEWKGNICKVQNWPLIQELIYGK